MLFNLISQSNEIFGRMKCFVTGKISSRYVFVTTTGKTFFIMAKYVRNKSILHHDQVPPTKTAIRPT